MNQFKKVLGTVLCVAITGIAVTATAQNKQGFATAVRVEGNVTYSLGKDQPEHPLVAGKYLPPGAVVFTKDNGVCDLILGKAIDLPQAKWAPERISLAHDSKVRGYVSYKPSADQNAIRLTPNSTLAIDKLTIVDTGADTVSDTELDLKKGKIFASVRKLSGASQYIIKLPNGIAGVRGTLFSLSADGASAVFDDGHPSAGMILALTLADGTSKTFTILPGQILDPVTGQTAVMSNQLKHILADVFDALRTTYHEEVGLELNENDEFISKVTGHDGSKDKDKDK